VQARGYALALGGFVVLLAGGLGLGLLLNQGPARLDPVHVELADPGPEWVAVAVGNTGQDGPATRQVREAAAAWCDEHACDAVLLLGDVIGQGGPTDLADPRLDERVGPWTRVAPVWLVAGDRDRGPLDDARAVGRLVRWTSRRDDMHLPSATWSARAGDVLLLGLDSSELRDGQEGAQAQRDWLDATLQASAARWPVAMVHDPAVADTARLCGRAPLVLHAGTSRGWTERCGTAFVSVGLGDGGDPPADPGLHSDPGPGFVGVRIAEGRATLTFVGADRTITFQAVRAPSGRVELPDGTALRTAPKRDMPPDAPGR